MPNELYEELNVAPEATAEEIKRSFFKLVRQHPPEKDPEKYKAIRHAYDTLSDPRSRADYDALQDAGDEIASLFEEGEGLMEEGEWEDAISAFKRIVVLMPGADTARNLIGVCLLNLGRTQEAVDHYKNLLERVPDNPIFWSNQGNAYWDLTAGDPHSPAGDKAIESLKRAIELDEYARQPYVDISRIYVDREDLTEALYWAEKAMEADGRVDMNDLECLLQVCWIRLMQGDLDEVVAAAKRLVPAAFEQEANEYVAIRFAEIALRLRSKGLFLPSLTYLEAAQLFDPDRKELDTLIEYTRDLGEAFEEQPRLMRDPYILQALCRIMNALLWSAATDSDEERDEIMGHAEPDIVALREKRRADLRKSLEDLRSRYPRIAAFNHGFLEKLDQGVRSGSVGQGCSMGVFIAVVTVLGLIANAAYLALR